MNWTRYVRLMEETTHGTPAAGGVYADPQSVGLDAASDQALFWPSAAGVDRQIAAGPYSSEGDVVLALDDVISGFLFKWLLGTYTTTGTVVGGGGDTTLSGAAAAGATTLDVVSATNIVVDDHVQIGTGDKAEVHKITAVNGLSLTTATPLRFDHAAGDDVVEVQAPFTHQFRRGPNPLMIPFTVGVGKDVFEHIFTGCVLGQLEIEVADQIIAATLGVMASRDSKGALAAAVAFGEGNLFAPHDVTASIGGTDESARVEGLTLTLNHNADLQAGRGIGSRFSRRGYRGQLQADGELTLAFVDLQELERFWGGVSQPGNNLTEFGLTLSFGAGLDIVMPRVVYTSAAQPLGGPGRIEQTASFRAVYDPATSTGPVEVTLVNDRPNY